MRSSEPDSRALRAACKVGFAGILCASSALADARCSVANASELATSLDGIVSILIETGAAELRVVGDEARTDLHATACDSNADAEVHLETKREGAKLRLIVSPDRKPRPFFLGPATSLLVSIDIPKSAHIEIDRTNGPVGIQGIAGVTVQGGTGTLAISDISGDVVARNGIGAMYLNRIAGNVEAEDGSGELLVSAIGGSLHIAADAGGQLVIDDVRRDVLIDTDGSGEIRITRVAGSVRVGRDGSGNVSVHDVRGGLTVNEKSQGFIEYTAVAGHVQIPSLPPGTRHRHK